MKRNLFNYIINEEKAQAGELGEKNTGRFYSIMKQRIERKFGTKAYFQTNRVSHRLGFYSVMVMLGDGEHAFALNYRQKTGGNIASIDFWIKPSSHPQLSAQTEGLNVLQIVTLIEEVLSKKRTGTFMVGNESSEEDEAPINEAKGDIDGESYYLRKKREKAEAEAKGLPTPIRTYKKKDTGEVAKVKVTKAVYEEPVQRDAFSAMFDDPLSETELFDLLEWQIDQIKAKKSKSLLILGDPGVGKSFTVLKKMIGENYEVFKGGITSASALFKTLFMHNDPDKVLVFDDLDTLLQDPVCTRMLKGALDSGENTEVAYISKNNVEPILYDVLTEKKQLTAEVINQLEKLKISTSIFETEHGQHSKAYNQMKQRALNPDLPNAIFPNKFDFIGRVIFISNFYLDQIPGSIVSRNAFIEVNLTLEQIIKRIEKALPDIEINGIKYDMKIKKEAMNYVKKILIPSGRIKKLDFRGFGDIMKFAASDAPTDIWYRWASVAMKQKYGEVEKQVNRPKR